MILYRNLRYQQLFDDMCSLLKPEEGEARPDAYACASQLIDLAVTYGFRGNLWHCFLAFCMANNENAYSTSCEIIGPVGGSLSELARHDFAQVRELFSLDIARLDETENGIWSEMKHYENALENSKAFNHRIRDRIVELSVSLENAESDQEFQDIVTEFYKEFGVGKFGLNKAFHIIMDDEAKQVDIEPITRVEHIKLSDLVGYELQKAKLIENTEAFIEGRAANNCLLFGDSGTGKSSSIKAILNQYYDRGLRMIEVYKHQFRGLSDVLEQIKDRNYKFIIYMDDLSFEEYELEYKYLKAIIEGGLGIKPQNVLIYATSNRRHLIRRKFSDKRAGRRSALQRYGAGKTVPGCAFWRHDLRLTGQERIPEHRPRAGRQIPHPYAGGRSASGSQQVGVKPRRAVRTYCHPVYCKLTQQAEKREIK